MAGIYLHIPFCKRRCIYCDFFSTTENEKKEAYIQTLVKELKLRKDYLSGETIDTIYLGGGTPSQLEEKDFAQLFDYIYKVYPVNPEAEITLEANPDDLTPAYVNMLRSLPFNPPPVASPAYSRPSPTSIPALPGSWISEHQHRLDVRTTR